MNTAVIQDVIQLLSDLAAGAGNNANTGTNDTTPSGTGTGTGILSLLSGLSS